jgi:hypothetical protein
MTNYTPPVYERTICNKAPEGYPHEELHADYILKRSSRELIQTNPPKVEPVINVQGEMPIMNRAILTPEVLFNGN